MPSFRWCTKLARLGRRSPPWGLRLIPQSRSLGPCGEVTTAAMARRPHWRLRSRELPAGSFLVRISCDAEGFGQFGVSATAGSNPRSSWPTLSRASARVSGLSARSRSAPSSLGKPNTTRTPYECTWARVNCLPRSHGRCAGAIASRRPSRAAPPTTNSDVAVTLQRSLTAAAWRWRSRARTRGARSSPSPTSLRRTPRSACRAWPRAGARNRLPTLTRRMTVRS